MTFLIENIRAAAGTPGMTMGSRCSWTARSVAIVLAASSLLSGCGGGDGDPTAGPGGGPEASYALCADTIGHAEMVRFLDGNLVVIASQMEQGVSAGQLVAGLVIGLVLNGIDFGNLAYEPSFSDGQYELTNGDAFVGFRLFFTEDFGDHQAGDLVPYNVFAPSSYVQNVSISGFDPSTGNVEVDYDPGPLFDLVDGEVHFDADDPTDPTVRLRIKTGLFAFEASSEKSYQGQPPREEDQMRVVMTTTRAPIDSVYAQLLDGGYGFSYTGTQYDSVYYGIDQELTESLFLMTENDDGGWFWEGDYQSTVVKGARTMYQLGFVSNLEENYTEYYCDAARTSRVGVAHHSLNPLGIPMGGMFVFEDGAKVPYGLGAF